MSMRTVIALSLKEEPHQQEVDGYAHAKHGKGCPLFAHAQPQEQVEGEHLQGVVDDMAQQESRPSVRVRLYPESIASRSDEVVSKADGVSHRHGDGGEKMDVACRYKVFAKPQQAPVDKVLKECGRHAHDAEAGDLTKLLPSLVT